jgi:2-keto-4-pentenoate hydratase/2-oxohepta-3-ene-1,7-dioic acid hydratase in catechol pathway
MRLLRHGTAGAERPGCLGRDGVIRDLSGHVGDITPEALGDGLLKAVAGIDPETLPAVPAGTRLGPCVARPGKVVCIGLNYADHAAEAEMPRPAEPIVFMKAASALCGPNDDLILPQGAEKTDWEVELGVVIGRSASYVGEREAFDHIAGYCIVNDVSERAFQLERNGQWTKGKSADTFCPLGPWLVSADEIAEPQNLAMRLDVDGQVFQDSSSAQMIFGIAELIAYLSRFMTLLPGDVIATGTPAGVGMGQRPPVYLRPGNRMRTSIEGLGEQCQEVVAAAGADKAAKAGGGAAMAEAPGR